VLFDAGQARVVAAAGAEDVVAPVELLEEIVLVVSVVKLALLVTEAELEEALLLVVDEEPEDVALLLVVNEELEPVTDEEDETLVDVLVLVLVADGVLVVPPNAPRAMLVGVLLKSTSCGAPKKSSSSCLVLIKVVFPRYPSMFPWPISAMVVVSSSVNILMSFVTPASP